ncbi:oligopeptide transporter, OPT family [bacterium]|nr:oligopeptide transporter, OPT family [bacterium]
MQPIKPYVSAETNMPETTVQAIVLGFILLFLLTAANVYVGLYAGMTVSAAIPAAVISMGVLKGILKRGTILENNIVHTLASSGESLAAGIIFTVPAIVLLGLWDTFNYFETTLIAVAGGLLGVLIMIPLRRSLIIENEELRYPEGIACAEVLKVGDKGGEDLGGIFWALGLGGAFKLCVSVFGLFKGTVEGAVRVGKSAFGGGMDISPMLVGVGFIVGWEIAILVFLGGAIAWFGAMPILSVYYGLPEGDVLEGVWGLWNTKIRYLGIGAMVVGGIWSIIKVRKGILTGVKYAVEGMRGGSATEEIRTERNIKGGHLIGLILASVVLIAVTYFHMTGSIGTTVITTIAMFILSFFFVAVASYIAGLVGSSNSPVSGMTICTVLITAGLLLLLGYTGASGMLATLGVAGVVCCAACLAGDISQDLKIGYILGATPKRQQWAEVAGTVAAAFIIAPIMTVLHKAYGIGEPAREGVTALKAPQAMLFKSLVGSLFDPEAHLPWGLVIAGIVLGVVVVAIDVFVLEPRGTRFRLHIMPMAVGIYLPLSVSTPLLVGGIAAHLVERKYSGNAEKQQSALHKGTIFASGIVAGEAIFGVLIAFLIMAKLDLPFAATKLTERMGVGSDFVSLVAVFAMAYVMMKYAMKEKR